MPRRLMATDSYGVEVEIGDVVVSATSLTGRHRIGKVYRFDSNGHPWIKVAEKDSRSQTYVWRKTSTGSSYIVLHKKNAARLTPAVNDRIELDYDASEPSFRGR